MKRHASLLVIVPVLISMVILPGAPAVAQIGILPVPIVPPPLPAVNPPAAAAQFQIPDAVLRTIDDMLASQASAPSPSGIPQVAPSIPNIGAAAYAAAKRAAAIGTATKSPLPGGIDPPIPPQLTVDLDRSEGRG